MSGTVRMSALGRERPGKGLTWRHKVLADELLDHLADRFLRKRVREMTRCSFEQYVVHPEAWERIADALTEGYGVQFNPECPTIVMLVPAPLNTERKHVH